MASTGASGLMQGQEVAIYSKEHAASLDAQDPLHHLRKEFLIPSKANLKAASLSELESRDSASTEESVYLCGNSLGLQPRLTSIRIQEYLTTWSTQGVFGHFKPLAGSPLPTWVHVDEAASKSIASIVGAQPSEVAVMETLTANLHLLMSAFYKPDINGRHKIILEGKAFPSDHYAVESQIRHHNLSLETSMITIESLSPDEPVITTSHILAVIEKHASTTALLLLPGIQFYTGQFLDIPTITTTARKQGIFVIWDLAHAVGNVPLSLHDWDVDAAAWCTYKYLNAGPGAIGGMFVHERNGQVTSQSTSSQQGGKAFVNRFSGWWGNDKSTRFGMENHFIPVAGAAGFQLSNPSVLDITSLNASLEIFAKAGGIQPLRTKSLKLTNYLEKLLTSSPHFTKLFNVITPSDKNQRGAQLSLKLKEGLLDVVMKELEDRGVVVDERKPDVIRVAPAPLYNSFVDVYAFRKAFDEALEVASSAKEKGVVVEGTRELEQTT